MRDRVGIFAGLLFFLGLISYPVWHSMTVKANTRPPALVLPKNAKECVAPVEYMRTSHMKLLLDWRDKVVRQDQLKYTAPDGKVYDMSLTRTCLNCHEKESFCDRCHTYAGVSGPYCWDCHLDPKQARRSAQ
jgi:[DsrC]-trisulfide reductase subunit J